MSIRVDEKIAAFTAYDGTLGHVQLTFNEPVDTKTLNVMVSTSTQLRYRETLACRSLVGELWLDQGQKKGHWP